MTSRWPDGPALRGRAVRRQRRRRVLGGLVAAVVFTVGMTVVLTDNGTPPAADVHTAATLPGAVQLVADTTPLAGTPESARRVALANQAFTLDLLRHLGAPDGNRTVSPWSLYVALGMLLNGATDATADQLRHTLGVASTDDLDAGVAAETRALLAAGTLWSANSLWTQPGFTPGAPFLTALAQYFRAGVWQTDFGTPAAAARINRWVSAQTHGLITKLFDQLDPATVLVLVNALYFHDAWKTPFIADFSFSAPFTTANGQHPQVHYMSGDGDGLVIGPGYQAFRLPYAHGGLSATAIMPTSGNLSAFVAGLTPATLATALSTPGTNAQVRLPRFATSSNLQELKHTLADMGVSDWGSLDGIGPGLAVDQIVQRAVLDVGEGGTTAAAATGVSVATSLHGPHAVVTFDQPFLFLVTDAAGSVLFASEITDPSR